MDYDTPEQNLFVTHGDDEARNIYVEEPVLDSQGRPVRDEYDQILYQPVDITGWIFYFTVKKHRGDPDNKALIGPLRFDQHDDAPHGKTHIGWTAAQTTRTPGTYYYDMERIDAAGKVKTFMQGRFVITRDITQGMAV